MFSIDFVKRVMINNAVQTVYHSISSATVERGCDLNLRGQMEGGHAEHYLNRYFYLKGQECVLFSVTFGVEL